jgi:hypothetical protein
VSATEFDRWRREGRPQGWSGAVAGGGIKHVSNEQMAAAIASGAAVVGNQEHFPRDGYYTLVEWETSWREAAGEEWSELMATLGQLTYDDGNDVRLVFFFDS